MNSNAGQCEIVEEKNVTEPPMGRRTSARMNKYEAAKMLGVRSVHLSKNYSPVVPLNGETRAEAIALMEYNKRVLPLVVRRYLPDGTFEDWHLWEFQHFPEMHL